MLRRIFNPTLIDSCYTQGLRPVQLMVNNLNIQPLENANRANTRLQYLGARSFHNTNSLALKERSPERWLKYNKVVFPPTGEDEPPRPAEIYHQGAHIKYHQDKMMYLCRMIRGMSIDEARKQLTFKNREGANILIKLLVEAQEMAVEDHNVEFKSNLWVAEAYPRSAGFIKGVRKHKGPRFGTVHYRYIHVFIKLRENKPPEHYYPAPPTGNEKKSWYLQTLRRRKILNAM